MEDRAKSILSRLTAPKPNSTAGFESKVRQSDLYWLCATVTPILRSQPVLISISAPVIICGDVHGQFSDLLYLFSKAGDPSCHQYLFLGDYVGRGSNSIETIAYLFALKICYPDKIWLLRGNHETMSVSMTDGFYSEFESRKLGNCWFSFNESFRWMPIAATVGGNRIFCVHGGISPNLKSLDDISSLKRPLDVPESGLLTDLLWSDPAPNGDGWQENERGIAVAYGEDTVKKFLDSNGFDLLCRAHEVAEEGFNFPFPSKRLVTIFSAPMYMGEYSNPGSFLVVGEDLRCKFELFNPEDVEKGGEKM